MGIEPGARESFARSRFSPTRVKRRKIVLLRGLLVVALGGMILQAAPVRSPYWAFAPLLVLALSDALLVFAPLRLFNRSGFELVVGGLDIATVVLALQLGGEASTALLASCLLMALVVAIGDSPVHAVASAAAIGAFHSWLVMGPAAVQGTGRQLVLQILFLCSVGLYFGYLVRRVHSRRRREEAERLERRELRVLLEILDAISSSLDLRKVALTIVAKLATVIPAVRCSMLFVDPAVRRCFVLASHDSPDLEMLEIDLKKYPEVRRALETRKTVLVQNVPDDPIMAEVAELLRGLDFHSILVVPLTFREQVLGTICLKTARAKDEFSEGDINFCTAVARASANALQNALLHDEVLEEVERHRRTGDKLIRILDHSPDLIVTTNREGILTEFNRGAEKLLGRRRDEVVGRPCEEVFGQACGRGLIEEILAEGLLSNHLCQVRGREGVEKTLEVNMAVLGEAADATSGTVWIGRDVTELKSAQLQLLQAKKLSTIGEVISGVAHELNNPLSGVLGFSQLLLARSRDDSVVRDLEKIHDSALRCQKIVRNLLSFSRVHKPERKYLGLNGIIEKTLELRKYQLRVNDIEIVKKLEPDLPRTMLDFHQMQQVFLNLIHNAEHAITSSKRRPGRLVVETGRDGDLIRARVSDNGVGMDHETLERIFDPFFTTKEPGQGTGLGLSVSYGIVKEHGGRIYARTRPGEGTTFTVELPIHQEREVAERVGSHGQAQPPPRRPVTGATMLVVDDEPLILDLIVDIFSGEGYRVDTAANGAEACRKIRQHRYDVVITDVRMPEMNGIELYGHIMALRPEMEGRVIFMTGDLIDKQTLRFLDETEAARIPKPLELPVVLETVARKVAGRHRP